MNIMRPLIYYFCELMINLAGLYISVTGSFSAEKWGANIGGGGTRWHILLKRSQESHDQSLSTNDIRPNR